MIAELNGHKMVIHVREAGGYRVHSIRRLEDGEVQMDVDVSDWLFTIMVEDDEGLESWADPEEVHDLCANAAIEYLGWMN